MLSEKLSKMTQPQLVDAYIKTLNWQNPNQQRVLNEIKKYLIPYYEAYVEFTWHPFI